MIYQPLKQNWSIDEDSAIPAVDQIKDRVNSESNYEWSKKESQIIIPLSERISQFKEMGRRFMRNKKPVFLW